MFVSLKALEEFTGKTRPTAQARFLDARGLKYVPRDDGTLALRQEELDAYTLSNPPKDPKRRRVLDLSLLKKAS
jgi:hypothetical protein